VIGSGAELFGTATRLADGTLAEDGFEALAALDTNRDGVVDANDAGFGSLKVWRDADSDGQTDAGELLSLDQAGVRSLNVQAAQTHRLDSGNFVGLVASYERVDGTRSELADVWFRVSRSELLDAQAAALSDALKSYDASTPEATPQAGAATSGEAAGGRTQGHAKDSAGAGGGMPLAASAHRLAVQELSAAIRHFEAGDLTRLRSGQSASSEDLHRDERRHDRHLLAAGPTGGGGGSD
jgi:hypothetical protein